MLAKRVIPTLLTRDNLLVKGEQFNTARVVGNALQAAKVHGIRGVDELMILDVTATSEAREPNYDLVAKLTTGVFIPVTVGGGIATLEHIRQLLAAGADKVCIGSAKHLITPAFEKFGRQAIVASLDFRERDVPALDMSARILEAAGAGEILLQAKDRDGTMRGYNLEAIEVVANAVGIPVIASGGCSGVDDMRQAFDAGASAAAAGALFQFSMETPREAARQLGEAGVEVRV